VTSHKFIVIADIVYWLFAGIAVWFLAFRKRTGEGTEQTSYPTLSQALFVMLTWLLISIAVGFTLRAVLPYFKDHPLVRAFAETILIWPTMLYLCSRRTTLPFKNILFKPAIPAFSYACAVWLAIGCVLGGSMLNGILSKVMTLQDLIDPVFRAIGIGTFFNIVIVGPFIEEYFFRGFILRGFLANYRPSLAILFSATLFSVSHLNPVQIVPTFLYGIFFGWMTYRTRSIIPALAMHVLINGSLYFFESLGFPDPSDILDLPTQILILLGASIVAAFAAWGFHVGSARKPTHTF
jgi:uncharacterized protein